jgi:formamidopyrimidine-DNA glycosylase
MPELPEVESFRRRFEAEALHRIILRVEVHDAKVLRETPIPALRKFLEGHSLINTHRRGKYFFAERDAGQYLHIHLGMTGDMVRFLPEEDPPRHTRVAIHFTEGPSLAYRDMRKFGHFYPVPDLEALYQQRDLGPDALALDEAHFLTIMRKRKGILKAALLDQSLLAGLGNLWIDEICLITAIHPASAIENIPDKILSIFFKAMQETLSAALAQNPLYHTYPTDHLWAWRKAGYCFPDGTGPVAVQTLAGRTTCTVPTQIKW